MRTLAAAEPVKRARASGALAPPELVAALRHVGFELDAELQHSAQGTSRERPELSAAHSSPNRAPRAPKRLRVEAVIGPGPPDEMDKADQSLATSPNSEFGDCDSGGTLARVESEPTPQQIPRETPETSFCPPTCVPLRPVVEPSRLAALAAAAAASITAPDPRVQLSVQLCESAAVPSLLKRAPSRTRVTGRALVRRQSASVSSDRSRSSLELSLDLFSCLSSPVAPSHPSPTSPAMDQLHPHLMPSDRSSIKELQRVLQQQQTEREFSLFSSNHK